jgi:outer membrane lipoprotein-sorting protein
VTTGAGMSEGSQVGVVKIKDDKIRMEMDSPQGKTIAIIDGDTMISYVPSQNNAVKMKSPMSRQLEVLSDYTAYLESLNAELIGSEKIGPYDCDIYEFRDPRVDIPSKVWLWRAKEFPVKVEMKTPSGIITTTMNNVKVGVPIADSEFTLPAGVEIVDQQQLIMQ